MASPERRAPENELNHGADMTLGTKQMDDRFSEAYARAFEVPLPDHNLYRNLLIKNFHPYSYAQLAAEYPCIVVRTFLELNAKTSNGLLELKPEHCSVEGIEVYTVGIACERIRRAVQKRMKMPSAAREGPGWTTLFLFPVMEIRCSNPSPKSKRPPGGGRILKPWICPSGRPMHPNWSPSSPYRL